MSTVKLYDHSMTNLPDDLFLVHPDDSQDSPSATTLSFNRTPTVLLTFAGNRFSRMASRSYQQEFGIGVMDWRLLVMLTREPGSSVSHAARTIGIDKAAVSRALHRMETAGFVSATSQPNDTRRKDWALTSSGTSLHARMLDRAVERQKRLLDGFSPEEVSAFTQYLSRFLDNLDGINTEEI